MCVPNFYLVMFAVWVCYTPVPWAVSIARPPVSLAPGFPGDTFLRSHWVYVKVC